MLQKQRQKYTLNTLFIVDLILLLCALWISFGAWRSEDRATDCFLQLQFQKSQFDRYLEGRI